MSSLECSVDAALASLDVESLDARELAARLGEVERTIRKLEAVTASIVATADRRELFRDDGHVSVRGWVKASIRVADHTVTHRVRTARLCAELPACHEALAAGRLGVDQVRELARAHANPRCGDQLTDVVDGLLPLASIHIYEVFTRAVRHWERLADADGAHHDHETAHAGRTATMGLVDDTGYLDARVGSAQYAAMREIFDRFAQAEFEAEWDELRARLGDDACPGRLERTESQRRADALAAIFARAAAADPAAKDPEPVVNIVIDQAIYETQLAAMAAGEQPSFEASDLAHQRCRTTNGIPIDPADAVTASVVGHVRRVLLGPDGVIIDLGRRSRTFTGSARDAALLQAALDGDGRCLWPGCGLHRCQIDHTHEWRHGGVTALANAGPLCPRHNRWKTRGYRTWRDPTGVWHTHRPDGTEIQAA
jgi:Domain of unknown function (DUF222)